MEAEIVSRLVVDCKREEDEEWWKAIEAEEQRLKKQQQQQQQHAVNYCTVCGRANGGRYKYYNAQCCESCKQFFRRIVVNQKEFHCFRNKICRKEQVLYCQGCRLDRCLLMGMEPSMVKIADKPSPRLQLVAQLEPQCKSPLVEQSMNASKTTRKRRLSVDQQPFKPSKRTESRGDPSSHMQFVAHLEERKKRLELAQSANSTNSMENISIGKPSPSNLQFVEKLEPRIENIVVQQSINASEMTDSLSNSNPPNQQFVSLLDQPINASYNITENESDPSSNPLFVEQLEQCRRLLERSINTTYSSNKTEYTKGDNQCFKLQYDEYAQLEQCNRGSNTVDERTINSSSDIPENQNNLMSFNAQFKHLGEQPINAVMLNKTEENQSDLSQSNPSSNMQFVSILEVPPIDNSPNITTDIKDNSTNSNSTIKCFEQLETLKRSLLTEKTSDIATDERHKSNSNPNKPQFVSIFDQPIIINASNETENEGDPSSNQRFVEQLEQCRRLIKQSIGLSISTTTEISSIDDDLISTNMDYLGLEHLEVQRNRRSQSLSGHSINSSDTMEYNCNSDPLITNLDYVDEQLDYELPINLSDKNDNADGPSSNQQQFVSLLGVQQTINNSSSITTTTTKFTITNNNSNNNNINNDPYSNLQLVEQLELIEQRKRNQLLIEQTIIDSSSSSDNKTDNCANNTTKSDSYLYSTNPQFVDDRLVEQQQSISSNSPSTSFTADQQMPMIPAIVEFDQFAAVSDTAYVEVLLRLVNSHWYIWKSRTELPFSYVFRHEELADFLVDQNNLLTNLEQFSAESASFWDKHRFIEHIEKFGLKCPDLFEHFLRGFMLALELSKLLPFVRQLALEDQQKLLRHSSKLVTLFFNAFYSMESGADTLASNNGLTFISALVDTKRFGGDQKLKTMGELVCCTPVQKFKQADIGREEFSLLTAILVANAAEIATDMSPGAREFLYQESVRLLGILLRLLQHKHGHYMGNTRFAAAVDLLSVPLKYGHDQHLLSIYLALVHQQTITTGRQKEPKFIRELWDHDFWINIR